MLADPHHPLWLACAWGSVATVVLGQAVFFLLDTRMPQDRNMVHVPLPELYFMLGEPARWGQAAWETVRATTGWYNLLLALLMRLFGRGPGVLDALNTLWFASVLASTLVIARRLAGAAAAAAAVGLLAAMPMLTLQARINWIHLPEMALLLGMVAVWQADPGLRRPRSLLGFGAAGALVLSLRPSGLVWIASLAPLLPAALRAWPARGPAMARLAGLALAWVLAALPAFLELGQYVQFKFGDRGRYMQVVPELWLLLSSQVTLPSLAVALAGCALALRWKRPASPVWWVVAGWLALTVVQYLVFMVGLDNFPLFAAALALAAGAGLTRRAAWPALVPLGLFLGITTLTWLPASLAEPVCRRVPLLEHDWCSPGLENHLRVHRGFSPETVRALAAATCPVRDRRCDLVVEQGLFNSFVEDPGHLELFLTGSDQVVLRALWGEPDGLSGMHGPPGALARFDCPNLVEAWRARYPGAREAAEELVRAFDLRPAWQARVSRDCRYLWLTPRGEVAGRGGMPPAEMGCCAGLDLAPSSR